MEGRPEQYDALYAAACARIETFAGSDQLWLEWLQTKQPGHWQLLQSLIIQVRKAKLEEYPTMVFEALLQFMVAGHFYCHACFLMRPEDEMPPPAAPTEGRVN